MSIYAKTFTIVEAVGERLSVACTGGYVEDDFQFCSLEPGCAPLASIAPGERTRLRWRKRDGSHEVVYTVQRDQEVARGDG